MDLDSLSLEPLSTDQRIGSVLIGIGSNLGDRVRLIERALGELLRHVNLERISGIYETEPIGLRDQPWFLNLVCMGTTQLKPYDLLEFLIAIEADLGRSNDDRDGPRPIDLDILAYDDLVLSEPDLEIPHPRLAERAFVLIPLDEIAPEWVHPVSGRTAAEALSELEPQLVRPYSMPPPPAAKYPS